jgi:predicted AlkP superfamily pyrophosphatase or phosphodiesterase
MVNRLAPAGLALAALLSVAQAPPESRRLIAIFVVDGLRPDSINAADTPTIERLRREGVDYLNSHSVFPTSTRINAASLITGAYPSRHGIVGNSMFVAGVNAQAPFDTGDYRQLIRLEEVDGRVVTTPTLGEALQRSGRSLVTLSSGTTGNGFLLNPQARHGSGVAIHGLFDPGRTAAFPAEVSDAVVRRFGAPPPDPDDIGQMEWTDTVLREYVLSALNADVIVDWMGPLDAAQHDYGVSSPEAKRALAAIDRSLARTLAAMEALTPARRLDVVITSDHGFAAHTSGVNVVQALIGAGLKTSATSTDVIVASQSQSVLFYVPSHDPDIVSRLVRFLQQQPWVDVVFTRGGTNGQGAVAGTLSLDMTKGSHPSRAPDVAASLSWTSSRNAFGVPGAQTIHSAAGGASRPSGSSGPITSGASGHGGLSPWVVRNTLVLWGHDFKSRARVDAPASLADLMPTILKVLALEADRCDSACGRVLEEALRASPQRRSAPRQRTVTTASGAYRASIRLSSIAGHDYVDQGSRER